MGQIVRCLVTGSTGFIGSCICRELANRGHLVRAFCRPGSSRSSLNELDVDYFIGDILEPDTLLPAMADVDWVFHVAAIARYWQQDPLLFATQVEGTRNVLQAARLNSVQRVIFTSSAAALGIPKGRRLIDETCYSSPTSRQWPYGHAKSQAEKLVQSEAREGLDCVIVNPTTVLGPGDVNVVSGFLVIEVARGRVPFVTHGGMNVVHVDDVASAHLAAARYGISGERYLVGGHNIVHADLIRLIATECNVAPPMFLLPSVLVRFSASVLDRLTPFARLSLNPELLRLSTYHFCYDTSISRRELHLSEPLSAEQAIREAVAWYRENGYFERSS